MQTKLGLGCSVTCNIIANIIITTTTIIVIIVIIVIVKLLTIGIIKAKLPSSAPLSSIMMRVSTTC